MKKGRILIPLTVVFVLLCSFARLSIGAVDASNIPTPTLEGFETTHEEAAVGEVVTLHAKLADDVLGINEIVVSYYPPEGSSGKWISLVYDRSTGLYEGSFTVREYDVQGTWKIDYLHMVDDEQNDYFIYNSDLYNEDLKGSNYKHRDLSEYDVVFTGGKSDTDPPTLHSLEVTSEKIEMGDVVTLSAEVTDERSGVHQIVVSYHSPEGNDTKPISLLYDPSTGKYEGSFIVEDDREGTWEVDYLYLQDYQQNYYFIYNADYYGEESAGLDYEYRDLSKYNVTR